MPRPKKTESEPPKQLVKHSLYGGSLTILFDEDTHKYTLEDGENLLSVTGVLAILAKPMLIPWAVNLAVDYLASIKRPNALDYKKARSIHREKKKEGGDIGKEIHNWIERYIKEGDRTLPTDMAVLNGVIGFLKWVQTHNVKFIQSERLVYSKEYEYVGTFDAIAEVDGRICLVDFKSSNSFYLEHALQVAAYRAAVEEEDGPTFTGANIVVRFSKEDGSFDVANFPDHEADLAAFRGLLTMKKRELAAKDYLPKKRI